jgi:hypothetical protein
MCSKLGLQWQFFWCRLFAGLLPLDTIKLKQIGMKNYKPGDRIICDKAGWENQDLGEHVGPKVDDVLTVLETHDFSGMQLLWFSEDIDAPAFPASSFRLFYDHNVQRIINQVGGYPKNLS